MRTHKADVERENAELVASLKEVLETACHIKPYKSWEMHDRGNSGYEQAFDLLASLGYAETNGGGVWRWKHVESER